MGLFFDCNNTISPCFNSWKHSSHYKVYELIRPGSKVLDIGCASGYFERELKKKSCNVTCIEIDHDRSEKAKEFCDKVIEADVERIEGFPFEKGFFDSIVCMGVIEHLRRPDLLLYNLKPFLAKDAELIIDFPNIARFEHRLRLLFGNFDYAKDSFGALGNPHLRFFTLKTATKLLSSSGYDIKKIDYTGLGSIMRVFPKLLAFEFLFTTVVI